MTKTGKRVGIGQDIRAASNGHVDVAGPERSAGSLRYNVSIVSGLLPKYESVGQGDCETENAVRTWIVARLDEQAVSML